MPVFGFSALPMVCVRLMVSFVKSGAAGKKLFAVPQCSTTGHFSWKNPSLFTDSVPVMNL